MKDGGRFTDISQVYSDSGTSENSTSVHRNYSFLGVTSEIQTQKDFIFDLLWQIWQHEAVLVMF